MARLKQVFPKKDTDIEKALQNGLKESKIIFETQKPIKECGTIVDIFISPNICIYADGDYWHSLPNVKERDKQQNIMLKNYGYIILRFKGIDIKNNIQKCINKIIIKTQ